MDMTHDHDHGGGGTESGKKSCPMIMIFHGGHCERILWPEWVASTVTEFVFSALAIFVLAFIHEALRFLREHLRRQAIKKELERITMESKSGPACSSNAGAGGGCSNPPLVEMSDRTYVQRIFGKAHVIQTLLYFVQIIIAYLLMLVFMNYNYWLCLAIVLGLSVGFFFFGWIKHDAYESECCG